MRGSWQNGIDWIGYHCDEFVLLTQKPNGRAPLVRTAPHVIYFDWFLDLRSGGPPGYLANLREGLRTIGCDAFDFVVREKDWKAAGPDRKTEELKKPLFFDETATNFEKFQALRNKIAFVTRHDWLRVTPEELLRINPQARRTVHAHTTIDLVKLHNTLSTHGMRHRVDLVLMSHSPESPAKEWAEVEQDQGAPVSLVRQYYEAYKNLDYLAFHYADTLLFPCAEAEEAYAATITEFSSVFRQKRRLYIPTGAAPPAETDTGAKALRQQHDLEEKFVVSYVGRHNSVKGYDTLCKVGARMLAEYADIAFLIGGREGPLPAPRANRWIEHGWTKTPGDIVKASDVFVLPNKQTYFDLMLLEVLSCSVPVICSKTGGNKHFEGQSTGILFFNTIEELEQLILHIRQMPQEKRKALGSENRRLYDQWYGTEQFARRFETAFQEPASVAVPVRPATPGTKDAVSRTVSIIVPIYNVESYLEACLQSLERQTHDACEFLLIDDGSTDGSSNIAARFSEQNERFVYYRKPNGGLSDARNFGIDRATGEWICFVDSDDMVSENYISELLSSAEQAGSGLAVCGVANVDDSGNVIGRSSGFIDDSNVYPFWSDNMIASNLQVVTSIYPSAWNKIYHKSVVEGIRFNCGLYYEDHPFFYKIFTRIARFGFVAEPLYLHRTRATGRITSDGSRRCIDIFTVLDIVESVLRARFAWRDVFPFLVRLQIRLTWERSWAISSEQMRYEIADNLRMRLDRLMVTREHALTYKDNIVESDFVSFVYDVTNEREFWKAERKFSHKSLDRISVRQVAPPRELFPWPMVSLDSSGGFILVHPTDVGTTVAAIEGLGFFGAMTFSCQVALESEGASATRFRLLAVPFAIEADQADLLLEGTHPAVLAMTEWMVVEPLEAVELELRIGTGSPSLVIYALSEVAPGGNMNSCWLRVRAIKFEPPLGVAVQ